MKNKFGIIALIFLLVLGLSIVSMSAWDDEGAWGQFKEYLLRFTANIIPRVDSTYDVGNATYAVRTVYTDSIVADTATYVDIDLTGTISCDTIIEHTSGDGVTIDGLLVKDSAIALGAWSATAIGMSVGGTGANLTNDPGGVLYCAASELAVLADGTAGKFLQSGGTSAPVWEKVDLTASTDVDGILVSNHGGTGNGFTKFSGATTAEKVYTLPDATCSILTDNAGVTAAQMAAAGKTFTATYTLSDISTEDTAYVMLPKCTVVKAWTVLSGTIASADAYVQLANTTTDLTNGLITIGFDGSTAGDVDSCTPSADNTFNGSTEYLRIWSHGTSTNAVEVVVTIVATMTD